MSEYNIFEELIAQQGAEREFLNEHSKYDYDRLFDADNRNPNAKFLTVEDMEVV